jgi:methionyl aminopeptidase
MAQPNTTRQPTIKSPREIDLMRKAGRIVAEVLEILRDAAKPGVSTADLDRIAKREIASRGGVPSFYGYLGYPAHICTSFNEQIVHGIPGARKIKDGDLVSIDCGAIYQGYHGDSAITLCIGDVPEEARRLVEDTRQSMVVGIEAARAGARLGDVSHAIQSYAEPRGYGIIREYVGHGIGQAMHEEPNVPNYGPPGRGIPLKTGLALAIEPMLTLGDWRTVVARDGWTVSTKDGSLSAHWEHTIAVAEDGPEVLTSLTGRP